MLRLSDAAARLVARGSVTAGPGLPGAVARLLLDRGLADPWWPLAPDPDHDVDDVTVVVPVRDRPVQLARLLACLPRPMPVIVVDDGSLDPERLAGVVATAPGARLVVHRENRGPAAARNTGLAHVRTPYVAFCDSDVSPVDGWLSLLRRHLADPRVALVAPRIVSAQTDGTWIGRYEQTRSSLDLGPDPATVQIRGRVSYVPSACLLARVDALGEGFDESLRSGEDVDLVWRLLDDGHVVRYEPAAIVHHDVRVGLRAWLARKAFHGTSAAPLAARHRGAVAPLALTPWTAALAVAILAQRRWSVPVAAGAAAASTAATAHRLRRSDHPLRLACVLTAQGVLATAWQTSSALTRHYWPAATAAAVVSPRARQALLVAAVAEGLADRHRTGSSLDPLRYVLAHRLDDLAYGTGVWLGCARARSAAALAPAVTGVHRRTATAAQVPQVPPGRPVTSLRAVG
ncbi:MAG: mycofactocin biosynthesis glycosyltransferase MftF [Nocardioides sp.]